MEIYARLEAQQVQIKNLEQAVSLKVDKPGSAGKPGDQSTASSNLVHQTKIAQLHDLIAVKNAVIAAKDEALASKDSLIAAKDEALALRDATIAQLEERNLALLSKSDRYREIIDEAADWIQEEAKNIESTFDEGDEEGAEDPVFSSEEEEEESCLDNPEEIESTSGIGRDKSDMYREAIHETADWLRSTARNIESTFDGGNEESAKDLTVDSEEKEKSSAHKPEERELTLELGQDVQEADQDRSHSPAPSSPSHTSVSREPASTSMTAELEATFHEPNLGESFLWPRRMRCAFMIKSDGRITGPIGDPFQPMSGWAVHLDVDAGRHGRPNVSLQFVINNGNKDAPVSRKEGQRTGFAITWRTGVVNDQRQMIRSFRADLVSDYQRGTMSHVPMIVDKCPDEMQQELTKLVCFTFISNSIEKPEFSATAKKPWRGLPIDVQKCLDTLFFQDEPRWFAIWFCVHSDPELAGDSWILGLQRAVNRA